MDAIVLKMLSLIENTNLALWSALFPNGFIEWIVTNWIIVTNRAIIVRFYLSVRGIDRAFRQISQTLSLVFVFVQLYRSTIYVAIVFFYFLWEKQTTNIYFVGEPGASEMTWMQVPGEKLLEPVVNMVIVTEHFFSLTLVSAL